MRGTTRALLTGLIGLALLAAAAVPAAAFTVYRSTVEAGYGLTHTGLYSATTDYTIPKITCVGGDGGVGPGAFLTVTLPTRSTFSGAGTLVACVSGRLTLTAGLVVNGSETHHFSVYPGNLMSVSVTETSKSTVVKVTDVTTKAAQTATGLGGRVTGAFIGGAGILSGGTQLGVDPFTVTKFAYARLNGKALGLWNPVALERVRGTVVQITPSAITNGMFFSLTFRHS